MVEIIDLRVLPMEREALWAMKRDGMWSMKEALWAMNPDALWPIKDGMSVLEQDGIGWGPRGSVEQRSDGGSESELRFW